MSDDEDRGRNDLIKAILRVLAIDPDDGTTLVYLGDNGYPIWGDPRDLARRILDALDEAYTNRDMQADHEYERAAETYGREEFF